MTKLRRPRFLLLFIAVIAIAIVAGAAISRYQARPVQMRVGGHKYTLEVARSDAQRRRGLGGRASMPADRGMLFAYDKSGRYCYWMKDMQFPLDIIWLDADKRIIKLEVNLSPETYPASYCSDGNNARYVIELNAGQASANGLRAGSRLDF